MMIRTSRRLSRDMNVLLWFLGGVFFLPFLAFSSETRNGAALDHVWPESQYGRGVRAAIGLASAAKGLWRGAAACLDLVFACWR